MEVNKNHIPLWKRFFDIFFSLVMIIILSPVLIAIAAAIKVESKGPILYVSNRVGKDFEVFPFLKFRSMRTNSDNLLNNLNNQYSELKSKSRPFVSGYHAMLISDDGQISEHTLKIEKELKDNSTFFKVNKDPRITRVGSFIRNTSLDELPQLFNVFLGDMSIVGNRPLPLYEAEKLTDDNNVGRFSAPSGITGLWQVGGRGKATVSELERKKFDIEYAEKYNFFLDLKILFKTLPAVIQRANV